jgi:hypothetical protein
MHMTYLRDKSLIPEGHIVEVCFSDFLTDKMGGLERIYKGLSLGDFEEVRPIYQKYLEGIKGYKKNKLQVDAEVLRKVNDRWAEVFEAFGYEMEQPA